MLICFGANTIFDAAMASSSSLSWLKNIIAHDHAISHAMCANMGCFLEPNYNDASIWRQLATRFFKIASISNEGYLWVIFLPVSMYFFPQHESLWRQFWLAVPFDLMLVGLIKLIIRRKRPNYQGSAKKSYIDFHIVHKF